MYQILEIPAAGAYGTVCVARRPDKGDVIALKVMNAEHVNNPKVLARTRDEALLLTRLHHPNIVRVHGMDEPDGRPVIEMELIRGATLTDLVEYVQGGLPVAEALEIALRATRALDYAWSQLKLIHRDIKPSNILVDVHGEVKVVDFGVARADLDTREAVTVSQVLGTRSFMAPERLDGNVDRPSGDVYAMGLVLYELLTGERLLLSLTLHHHNEKLEAGLAAISPPGLDDEAADRLRELIRSMICYFEQERPSLAAVLVHLEDLISLANLEPDLGQLARTLVQPIYHARPLVDPPEHPAWSQVAFLHTPPAAEDVQAMVRGFLSRGDWPDHLPDLRTLLALNPSWSEAPFLELLERAALPWWKFWGPAAPRPRQVAAALSILHHRPTARALALAQKLSSHPHHEVRARANDLLDLARRAQEA